MLFPVSLWGLFPYLNPRFPAFHSIRRNCNGRSVTATCGCTSEPKFESIWNDGSDTWFGNFQAYEYTTLLSCMLLDTWVIPPILRLGDLLMKMDIVGQSRCACSSFGYTCARSITGHNSLYVLMAYNYAESWSLHPNKGYYHLHRRDGSSCRLGSDL